MPSAGNNNELLLLREDNKRLTIENNTLRADLGYWKSRHRDAVSREEALKKALQDKNARITYLTRQLYERKSEQSGKSSETTEAPTESGTRKRGQQRGRPSPKRRDQSHLPEQEELYDLRDSEQFCSTCGLPFTEMLDTEDSSLIETQEVRGYTRKIRRKKYKPGCRCAGNKGIITAPGPAKLIPHSRYGASVWIHVLIRKYRLQIPITRILKNLSLHGLSIPKGSVGDGLKRLAPLFEPIYAAIEQRSKQSAWWQADETRWNVFETTKSKTTFRWYLWVFASSESVVHVIDPTRSSEVIEAHLGHVVNGVLLVDRFAAYKSYARRHEGIILAFCWSHTRRDFRDAGLKYPQVHQWAEEWERRINELFHLNSLRLQYTVGSSEFHRADMRVKEAAAKIKAVLNEQRRLSVLHHKQQEVLKRLENHWEGLTVFLDRPHIPMDNNGSERILRNPVVGRKNYYGSGTPWSARFTAVMFSIFETLELWKINELEWLSDYLRACALAGGTAPEDISEHLPWNIIEREEPSWKFSGRRFTQAEVECIRAVISEDTTGTRTAIAQVACDQLGWYRADGSRKTESMFTVLRKMETKGLIELPPPRPYRRSVRLKPVAHTARTDAREPLLTPAGILGKQMRVEIAETDAQKSLWNEYVDRYHYLGYAPLAGAQLKYLVYAAEHVVALLGFGASAWKIAPREWHIGWSSEQREKNLHLVVNNARFLILPWIQSKNLASMILSRTTSRLGADWLTRYRYEPVLLETFVEQKRFTGACYRAANWKLVGSTKGRGKKDRFNEARLPVKDIYLYPLRRDFKQQLC
jgi:transposase